MGSFYSRTDQLNQNQYSGFHFPRHDNNNDNDKVETVIVPVDDSEGAEHAFKWYIRHLHQPTNVVRVVHCNEIKMDANHIPELRTSTLTEQYKEAQKTGIDIIQKYEKHLRDFGVQGSVVAEFAPSPGEMVIASSDRFKANMIVMGTRGFGVIKRTILGSVSHYVIHHASVPVTIVPGKDT